MRDYQSSKKFTTCLFAPASIIVNFENDLVKRQHHRHTRPIRDLCTNIHPYHDISASPQKTESQEARSVMFEDSRIPLQ
jgi:hypothetical protein